jgi:hypothetical protein
MTKAEARQAAADGAARTDQVWIMGEIRTDVQPPDEWKPGESFQPTGEFFALPAADTGNDPRPMRGLEYHYPPGPAILMEYREEHYRDNPPGSPALLASLPAEWFRPADRNPLPEPEINSPMDVLLSDGAKPMRHGPGVREVHLTFYIKTK